MRKWELRLRNKTNNRGRDRQRERDRQKERRSTDYFLWSHTQVIFPVCFDSPTGNTQWEPCAASSHDVWCVCVYIYLCAAEEQTQATPALHSVMFNVYEVTPNRAAELLRHWVIPIPCLNYLVSTLLYCAVASGSPPPPRAPLCSSIAPLSLWNPPNTRRFVTQRGTALWIPYIDMQGLLNLI